MAAAEPLIVDVDRHLVETWSIFQAYGDPSLREHLYRKVTFPDGSAGIALGERVMAFSAAMWDDPYANRMFDDDRFAPNLPIRQGLDLRGYVAAMDTEGIDVAYVTPTLSLGNGTIPNGFIGSALSRAYGRWAHDFCSGAGERLGPVYPLNLFDVEQAVKDARWAVEDLRMAGLMIIALPVRGVGLHDPAFDPIWETAQDLDVPVMVHSISSLPDREGRGPLVDVAAGVGRFGGCLLLHHLISHRVEQQLAVASFVGGGILERFSRLRVIFTEAGGAWMQNWLEEMDARWGLPKMRESAPQLKMAPREYFRRQCLVAFHATEPVSGAIGGAVTADTVAWSSDFPHHDCLFPGAGAAIRTSVAGLPATDRAAILGGNAARFFHLKPGRRSDR